MGVCPERNTEGSSETEICELEVTVLVDEQVLRFEISMKDSMSVTVVESLDELEGEALFDRDTKKAKVSIEPNETNEERKSRGNEGREGRKVGGRMLNEP